ncbi:MAG: dTDP-4-dehydrorhamnose reductase, partial [Chitinophagaceae bacterium]|nr:dTDP-4-dehydrorhamnose reductase [Chitinophagaceae bacterium]
GQLGQELKELSPLHPDFQFFFLSRSELDITDDENIRRTLRSIKPEFVINCAAYTAVDRAEREAEQAFAINAAAVKNLAWASKKFNSKFIHISTDYVFDGTSKVPYKETDLTNPINVYGASKLQGELDALQADHEVIIIRTSWVYSSYGQNFVKTMLRLMDSKPELNVVNDQYGSPTYAADIADTVLHIIRYPHWHSGIYHYSNDGVITWFAFAQAIKEFTHTGCNIHPVSTEQYPTLAKRPKYSVLDKKKIQKTYSVQLKSWEESLHQCLIKLTNRGDTL